MRPDNVLTGLRRVAGLTPSALPPSTRLAQEQLDAQTATVRDPLEPDRDAAFPGDRG